MMNVYKSNGVAQYTRTRSAHYKEKHPKNQLLSPAKAWTTTQPLSLDPALSNTKMILSDSHYQTPSSVSLFTSNHKKSLPKRRYQGLETTQTQSNVKCSKLLLIAFSVVISVVALAALGIAIYDLIRGIHVSTTTHSTTTATAFALRWQAMGTTVAGTGTAGSALDRLYTPYSIALDSVDALYIADYSNNRIQKFTPSSSMGITVAGQTSGTTGSGPYDLRLPMSVLVDSNGNIYVSDSANHRVQFFSNGSFFGTTVAGTGTIGNSINELSSPRGLALNPVTGHLYIVDNGNHRVMSYLSGVSTIAAGGNGSGILNTQLNSPTGLAFDSSSNSLYIANMGSHNIVRWIVNASSWTLVAGSPNGAVGSTSTTLYNPIGVTLDSLGNIYVADYINCRIQLFTPGKLNGTTIAGVTTVAGNQPNLFYYPYSVALDSHFNLYVADAANQRIQMFLRY